MNGYIVLPNDTTVDFEEMGGSPEIRVSAKGVFVRSTFKIAWSEIWLFTKQVLGWSEVVNNKYVFHRPMGYTPVGLLIEGVIAMEIESISGYPRTGLVAEPNSVKEAEYREALVIVRFENPPYDTSLDRPFITESIEPSAEFITLSVPTMYWDETQTNAVANTEAPGLINKMFEWVYTFHMMPEIPTETFDFINHVNEFPVYSQSLNRWFAEETVLFGNPSMSREWTYNEISMWTITLRLTVRNEPWYNYPHPLEGGLMEWSGIFDDQGEQVYFYPMADLRDIII